MSKLKHNRISFFLWAGVLDGLTGTIDLLQDTTDTADTTVVGQLYTDTNLL